MESPHNFEINGNKRILLGSIDTSIAWPKNTSAVEYILSKAKEHTSNGDTEWITNSVTGHSVKLDELDTLSRKVASAMYKRGMRKGDVAIYLTNDVTTLHPIMIGVWRVGGIFHSSYPQDTHDTLAQRLNESKAKWIFCDPNSALGCKEATSKVDWSVEIFTFGKCDGTTLVKELFLDDGYDCPAEVPNPGLDEPLLIFCTSGTTGPSKGAVHTNRSILATCLNTASGTKKLAVLIMKSTHLAGITIPLWYACLGWPLVMMHEINIENVLSCVSTYQPPVAIGSPTYLMELANSANTEGYDLSSLEALCATGMPVTERVYEATLLLPNVKVVGKGYALTECGLVASTVDPVSLTSIKSDVPKLSVGRPCPNVAVKILDVATGHCLGPMARGEIVVKSPTMASGYWKRPEETSAAFVDRWFKTGDLGYYDNDGYIFIEDRIKDTFKYYNNHISPTELEATILQHPAVAEVAVFGIEDPSGGDRIPRAVVMMKTDATATATEIRDFADSKLAHYKQLRGGLYIVDALPRGNTGKVVRFLAAKLPLPV